MAHEARKRQQSRKSRNKEEPNVDAQLSDTLEPQQQKLFYAEQFEKIAQSLLFRSETTDKIKKIDQLLGLFLNSDVKTNDRLWWMQEYWSRFDILVKKGIVWKINERLLERQQKHSSMQVKEVQMLSYLEDVALLRKERYGDSETDWTCDPEDNVAEAVNLELIYK